MTTTINALTTGGGGAVVTGDSSGALALQTNNGTTALSIDTSQNVTLTNPLALGSGGTGKTTASSALTNLTGYTTTATAGGTTTLTNTSSWFQYFTGSTSQTVVMPVTSTLVTGWSFHIVNNSSAGNLTINSSGGNLIATVVPGVSIHITCVGTTLTTAADWDYGITDFTTTTGSGGTAVLSTTPTVTNLVLAAGTSSLAPLKLTTGTNLSAAAAGNLEWNGYPLYFTPTGTQRGIIPCDQYYELNTAVTGSNATGAQSIFGVGVTLGGSTIYEFESVIIISKSAGTTSHNFALGFGGTATLNNINYKVDYAYSATSFATVVTPNALSLQVATATNINSGIATAGAYFAIILKGTVSINAGGTFIPQYTLSVAPGGAYTTAIGSYFKITPLAASGANVSIGTWA